MDSKSWFDLTPAERKARKKLTAVERLLVDDLLRAARALPKSICLEILEPELGYGTLVVRKRVAKGTAAEVARLYKRSLKF